MVERDRQLLTQRGLQVDQYVVDNPATPLASARALVQAPWNARAAHAVVAQARRTAPDVVHVHNTWFSLSPSVVTALWRAGFPVVMTLHNFRTSCINALLLRDGQPCTLCVGDHPWHGVWHRCYRDSAVLSSLAAAAVVQPRLAHTWHKAVAAFIALDESMVPLLAPGGIPSAKIAIRRNWAPDPGPRRAAPSQGSEVLFVGRLSHEKGVDLLLEAWRRAAPPGLTLAVCGDGPMRAWAEGQRVPGVSIRGPVDEDVLQQQMLTARALVFPSVCYEAGPLAPIEAAAAGLPTIISSRVGFSSRVEEHGAGWSAPAGDVQALAAALSRLGDGAQLDEAGKAARVMYEQSHSDRASYESLLEVYERVVPAQG